MIRAFLLTTLLVLVSNCVLADHHENDKQFVELRYYQLRSPEAAKNFDSYLTGALVPALNRAGSKSVGVLKEAEESEEPLRLVIIAHDKVADFAGLNGKLAKDEAYQKAAEPYMSSHGKDSPLKRMRSELLDSFDCWPKLTVPENADDDGRIFELRTYESTNQRYGDLKVEMFNSGEVPIFLDCGIKPVFMGQAIAGDKLPNLTYMTVYPNEETKSAGWKGFSKHPDWQVLKKVEKYKGTVSKIHKIDLVPVKGSQL